MGLVITDDQIYDVEARGLQTIHEPNPQAPSLLGVFSSFQSGNIAQPLVSSWWTGGK